MLSSLLAISLAAGIGTTAPDTSSASFVANLAPDAQANTSVANAEGLASIKVSNDSIQYRLSLRNVKHVTDIAIVDAGRAITLAAPGDTRGNAIDLQGTVATTSEDEIPLDQLLADMHNGKAQVVVFTTNEPGGAITGTLQSGTTSADEQQ
jgi:hypothetical protein